MRGLCSPVASGPARSAALGGLVLGLLAGCWNRGGGGDDPPATYWVSIDPAEPTTVSSSITLFGEATCDACPPPVVAFGSCPPVQGPFPSAVEVWWTNATTGESGSAAHGISGSCSCFFSYCTVSYSHLWSATVPLVPGLNEIEVVALGPDRDAGSESVTVTRAPAAPLGLVAEAEHGAITLRWEPVPEASSYTLYWSAAVAVDPVSAQRIPGVTAPFLHAGLVDDVTYAYAVTATAAAVEGPLSAAAWATAGWRTVSLPAASEPWEPTAVALACDGTGAVHVHLSRTERIDAAVVLHNEYLTDAGGSWTAVPVAEAAWGAADLALDSLGGVHVAYLGFGGATHAVRDLAGWTAEVVDERGTCAVSLALDALDGVHLAYRAVSLGGTGEVRYASSAGGAWSTVLVDGADVGCRVGTQRLSLAVAPDGAPHVAYAGSAPEDDLRYAVEVLGGWTLSIVDAAAVGDLSLALDPSGRPHVAYVDALGRLVHARREPGGSWTVELVDAGPVTAPELVLDARGAGHLSYVQLGAGELRYATGGDGSWRIVRVAATSSADTDLAVDSEGRVHIGYLDGERVRYATNR